MRRKVELVCTHTQEESISICFLWSTVAFNREIVS